MRPNKKTAPYIDLGSERKKRSHEPIPIGSHPNAKDRYRPMTDNNPSTGVSDHYAKMREEASQVRILDPSTAKIGPSSAFLKQPPHKQVAPPIPLPVASTAQPQVAPPAQPQVANQASQQTTNVCEPKECRSISLVHYHITGGKGWQRIYGYVRGTEVQPIQIIRPGTICAISMSHSGIGSLPAGSISICKNIDISALDANSPISDNPSVIGTIRINAELTQAVNFTLTPDEITKQASWESKNIQLDKDDRLSLYADNLSGMNIEVYIEYQ